MSNFVHRLMVAFLLLEPGFLCSAEPTQNASSSESELFVTPNRPQEPKLPYPSAERQENASDRTITIENAISKSQISSYFGWVKKGRGCSVSYILYDQDGDFAIFKPKGGDPWGSDVSWFAGKWRRKCLQSVKTFRPFLEHIGGDVCCEVASKRIADVIRKCAGLPHDLVSPTAIVSLILPGQAEGKTGSFQIFEKGVVSGKDYLGLEMDYSIENVSLLHEQRREAFCQPFQWLVILDVITGHMDRHTNNFMIREEDGSLLAIDGNLSFSPWHPDPSEDSPTRFSASEEMQKLYSWANPKAEFKLANNSFTEESKEAIKKIYESRYELQSIVEEVYKKEGGSMGTERAQTMIQRVELLYTFSQCRDFKIKDFWNYRTKEQIEKALSVRLPSPFYSAIIENESMPSSTICDILTISSLLADKYDLRGDNGGAVEKKLNEITFLVEQYNLIENACKIIEVKLMEVEALANKYVAERDKCGPNRMF